MSTNETILSLWERSYPDLDAYCRVVGQPLLRGLLLECEDEIRRHPAVFADGGNSQIVKVARGLLARSDADSLASLSDQIAKVTSEERVRLKHLAIACGVVRVTTPAFDPRYAIFFFVGWRAMRGSLELANALMSENPWISLPAQPRAGRERSPWGLVDISGRVTTVRRHAKTTFVDVISQNEVHQIAVEGTSRIRRGDYVALNTRQATNRRGESILVSVGAPRVIDGNHTGSEKFTTLWQQNVVEAIAFHRIRDVFTNFTETFPRVLTDAYEGGLARPFVTFENARRKLQYASVTGEPHILGLIAGGARRVRQFGHSFRNEAPHGRPTVEFPLFEAYSTDHDLNGLTQLVCSATVGLIDVSMQVRRLSFSDAFEESCGFAPSNLDRTHEMALRLGIKGTRVSSPDWIARTLFKAYGGRRLNGAVIISDIPGDSSPFTKGEGISAVRLWLRINGKGIAEIAENETDPRAVWMKLQRQEWNDNPLVRRRYDSVIEALACGIPPVVGVGIGLERLVSMLPGLIASTN